MKIYIDFHLFKKKKKTQLIHGYYLFNYINNTLVIQKKSDGTFKEINFLKTILLRKFSKFKKRASFSRRIDAIIELVAINY